MKFKRVKKVTREGLFLLIKKIYVDDFVNCIYKYVRDNINARKKNPAKKNDRI